MPDKFFSLGFLCLGCYGEQVICHDFLILILSFGFRFFSFIQLVDPCCFSSHVSCLVYIILQLLEVNFDSNILMMVREEKVYLSLYVIHSSIHCRCANAILRVGKTITMVYVHDPVHASDYHWHVKKNREQFECCIVFIKDSSWCIHLQCLVAANLRWWSEEGSHRRNIYCTLFNMIDWSITVSYWSTGSSMFGCLMKYHRWKGEGRREQCMDCSSRNDVLVRDKNKRRPRTPHTLHSVYQNLKIERRIDQ